MSSFVAWKTYARSVGPGVLLWVRKPSRSKRQAATHDHWFLVVDVTPSGKLSDGSKIHIVGISSHPQDKAAAIPMNTAGTPLKGECYACLDWELDDQLTIVESDEDGWDFEVRGAQLDRWDEARDEPWFVDFKWFSTELLPARKKYHLSHQGAKSPRKGGARD